MLTSLLADKLIRFETKKIRIFMNEFINPPCNSSLATSCFKFAKATCCDEGKVAALFTEGVSSSAEGELAINETASTVSLAPNICLLPDLSVAVREGEECVRDFLDHLSDEKCAAGHLDLGGEADDNDSFVDIMSGIPAARGAESEGWTFADALARANLSVETLAKGVVETSHLPTG